MDKDRLIHETFEDIDWNFVANTFKKLGLVWYDSSVIPTKKEIVADFTEILYSAIAQYEKDKNEFQSVTNYWVVGVADNELDGMYIEVMFTPTHSFVSSNDRDVKDGIQLERLQERLDIAIEAENYEMAGLLNPQINEIRDKNEE